MRRPFGAWGLLGWLVMVAGCGSTPSASGGAGGTGGSGGGSGGAGAQGGVGGAGAQGGTGGLSFGGTGGTSGGGTGGFEACAGETVEAELVPLDMYVMLDKSGSMADKTGMMGQGTPKWDAVTGALSSFLSDPASAGLGVGIQYFPLVAEGVPPTCSSNQQCGAFGPCVLKTCSGQGVIVPCDTNQDCPAASQ